MSGLTPPERVTVGPHVYTLKLDTDGALTERGQDGEHYASQTLILYGDAQSEQHRREVILHELTHAVATSAGVEHDLDAGTQLTSEQIVRRLTPGLLDLLRRNPELVAYLTDTQWESTYQRWVAEPLGDTEG